MKYKVTSVAGITENEDKHPLVRFETNPQTSADILNYYPTRVLILEHDPKWSDPNEIWTTDYKFERVASSLKHPFIAFKKFACGGFIQIEKGE